MAAPSMSSGMVLSFTRHQTTEAAKDKLGTHTGTFTYQVCETDSGDCSNEVVVPVQ